MLITAPTHLPFMCEQRRTTKEILLEMAHKKKHDWFHYLEYCLILLGISIFNFPIETPHCDGSIPQISIIYSQL